MTISIEYLANARPNAVSNSPAAKAVPVWPGADRTVMPAFATKAAAKTEATFGVVLKSWFMVVWVAANYCSQILNGSRAKISLHF